MVPASLFLWTSVTFTAFHVSQGPVPPQTVQALYHTAVNFTCNNPTGPHVVDLTLHASTDLRRVWILPNDDLVDAGMITEHDRVDVLNNGVLLHVRDVDDEDFGWYYCLICVMSEKNFFVQKHGLNVNGPYWGDLFALKYKGMMITGLVAGAVCLVSMGLVCFLYGKQQGKLDKLTEEERATVIAESVGKDMNDTGITAPGEPVMIQYINVGYVADGDDSGLQKSRGSQKGPAPGPPGQQTEMQNVAAAEAAAAAAVAADGDAGSPAGGGGDGVTKL